MCTHIQHYLLLEKVYTHACTKYMFEYIHECVYLRMYVCKNQCMYVCMYLRIMFGCMHVCWRVYFSMCSFKCFCARRRGKGEAKSPIL